jgi:hypothetical protein
MPPRLEDSQFLTPVTVWMPGSNVVSRDDMLKPPNQELEIRGKDWLIRPNQVRETWHNGVAPRRGRYFTSCPT